jgi:hypothetical protein
MATTNSIGEFTFISLDGNPETIHNEVQLLIRPGVDGVALWLRGSRGRPFQLRSFVDATDFEAARGLFASYCELIGADPVALVWADLDMSTSENFTVAVLNVQLVRVAPLMVSAGGLNSPSEASIECVWDLIPIANEE